MRVLLIQAKVDVGERFSCFPLSVLYIASSIRDRYDVRVLDQNFEETKIAKTMKEFSPHIVGISFSTGSKKHAFDIVKRFKCKDIIFVAGGVHATARPMECLEAGFDYVIRGEGEITFPLLIESLERKRKPLINGVAFRDGKSIVDNGIGVIRDLDSLTFPARKLIDKKTRNSYQLGMLMGSRGCMYKCIFCNSCGSLYRQRGVESFIKELEYCLDHFPQRLYHFPDDSFTYNPAWTRAVCKAIREKRLDFEWSANSRADLKDASLFKNMKDAHCQVLSFGIESGSQKILNAASKGIDIKHAELVVAKAMKQLKVRTEWIVALPGEYGEQIKSVVLMKKLQTNQIMVNLNTPYPGSPQGDNPEKFGIHLLTKDWNKILNNIYAKNSFWKAIRYDYLTKEQIININNMILDTLLPLGYKLPEKAAKDDKILKTFLQPSVLHMTRA